MTVKEFFHQILIAIDYPGDREKIANDFITNIKIKALESARKNMSEDQIKALTFEISKLHEEGKTDTQSYADILNKNTPRDLYRQALQKASTDVMKGYLVALQPSLNLEQKKRLGVLIKNFDSPLNEDT